MSRSFIANVQRVIPGGTDIRVSHLSLPTLTGAPAPALLDPIDESPSPTVDDAGALVVAPDTLDPAVIEAARLEAAARGYEDGFAAGTATGRADAMTEAGARSDALLTRLDEAVRSLEHRNHKAYDDFIDEVTHFAMATVEALLARELAVSENTTREAIKRALRSAPDRLDATVVVHPDDRALLGSLDAIAGSRSIRVVEDASVERGGCVVRVDECEIDAQITTALRRLREVLGVKSGDAP